LGLSLIREQILYRIEISGLDKAAEPE
jgi:hypothetical protein